MRQLRVFYAMLNVKGKGQHSERISTKLLIILGHVEKESFFVAKVEIVLQPIVQSEFTIMLNITLLSEGLKVVQ